jgi:hypothetical protein
VDLRARVLLSLQRALLGEVTAQMRAIEVEWSPTAILIRVFAHGPVTDSLRDNFDASVVTQVVADFPYPDRGDPHVTFDIVRCDAPAPIAVSGTLVFARAEP